MRSKTPRSALATALGVLCGAFALCLVSLEARALSAGDYLAATFAADRNDIEDAAEYYNNALRADPDNLGLLHHAFRTNAAAGRFDRAVPMALQLFANDTNTVPVLSLLIADAVQRDKLKRAREYWEEMSEEGLGRILRPILGAWVALAAGETATAEERLRPMGEVEGFDRLYNLHLALLHDVAGERDAARTAYDALLESQERFSIRPLRVVGNFYERIGERETARGLYESFVARGNDRALVATALDRLDREFAPPALVADVKQGIAESLFHLASLLSDEQAWEVALIFTQTALRLRPDLNVALLLKAEILTDRRQYEAAIAALEQVPAGEAMAWQARLDAAGNMVRLGRIEAAIETYKTLGEERPERFEPSYLLGNLLRAEERYAEAAEAYRTAVERLGEPQQRHWSLFYFLGIALERSDQWPPAEEAFQRALELEPEEPRVMNYLAYSWIEQGRRFEKAESMLKRAVELRPRDGYIVDSLGWVYYRMGRYEEAVTWLERAVERQPLDPTINDHLGDAYWRVDRRHEARFQWRRALNLDPEEERISEIEQKLEDGLPPEGQDL